MNRGSTIYNILTFLVLLLTAVCIVVYAMIGVGRLDPFPPRATSTIIPTWTPRPTETPTFTPSATATPTNTPTPSFTPTLTETPTDTPTITLTPTDTLTPTPITPTETETPPPTETPLPSPTPEGPTATPTPTEPPYAFILQGNQVTFVPQFVYPSQGCNWEGIAGQVLGLNGEPLSGLLVHVWGSGIDTIVTSGTNPNYGQSGWEQFVDNRPNGNEYFVQLMHPDTRQLSDVIRVVFPNSCAGNLALVYFQQVKGF